MVSFRISETDVKLSGYGRCSWSEIRMRCGIWRCCRSRWWGRFGRPVIRGSLTGSSMRLVSPWRRSRRPPPPAAPRRALALGRRHHRRHHPAAGPTIRLTSRDATTPKEGEHTRACGTPPTRRDSRATSHGPAPENHPPANTLGQHVIDAIEANVPPGAAARPPGTIHISDDDSSCFLKLPQSETGSDEVGKPRSRGYRCY